MNIVYSPLSFLGGMASSETDRFVTSTAIVVFFDRAWFWVWEKLADYAERKLVSLRPVWTGCMQLYFVKTFASLLICLVESYSIPFVLCSNGRDVMLRFTKDESSPDTGWEATRIIGAEW